MFSAIKRIHSGYLVNLFLFRQKIAQYHVSLFSAMKALGSILASWYSTYLMEFYGNRGVFLFAAVCPLLIMSIAAFLFDETPDDSKK